MIATLEPDVVVEQGEPQFEAVQTPSVVLVDDPRAVWRNEIPAHDERARAVLSRDATADEIVAAVVAVAAGLVAVQPHTLAASMEFVTPGLADRERLSPRESEVLIQLARGAGNKQIAAALTISEHTVKFHLASIFAKLGVSSRTEAVTQGVRRGLIML
jgi:two-component system, NarL family, response regulator YdfI